MAVYRDDPYSISNFVVVITGVFDDGHSVRGSFTEDDHAARRKSIAGDAVALPPRMALPLDRPHARRHEERSGDRNARDLS